MVSVCGLQRCHQVSQSLPVRSRRSTPANVLGLPPWLLFKNVSQERVERSEVAAPSNIKKLGMQPCGIGYVAEEVRDVVRRSGRPPVLRGVVRVRNPYEAVGAMLTQLPGIRSWPWRAV